MKARVLVSGAGSGAGNNLIRSLKTGDPELFVAGCSPDRFVLKKSPADRNYLLPPGDHPDLPAALRRVVRAERIDLVIPTTDADARLVSRLRARIPCRLLLPRHRLIELCQDKYVLTAFLRARNVPVPVTRPVTDRRSVGAIFRRLAPPTPLWCRIRTGSSSMGATPVRTPSQARSWIELWKAFRGVPARAFTLSEFLPGREFSVQALWKDGRLVLIKMCEMLSYFGGWNQPSGVSSTPSLARTLHDARVIDISAAAIRALDRLASGVFSIDLKENRDGVPCVTEINAGRFCMITPVYDLTGQHNMATTYVRLALDEPTEVIEDKDIVEDHYLVRDLDTLPGVFHADHFFEGIDEVGPPRPARRHRHDRAG